MEESKYQGEEELMEIDFPDATPGEKGEYRRSGRRSNPNRGNQRRLILGAAAILVILALLVIFFRTGNRVSKEFAASIQNQVRDLDNRITRFDQKSGNAIAKLSERQKELESSLSRLRGSVNQLSGKMDKIARELEKIKRRFAASGSEARDLGADIEKGTARAIPRYHVVRKGDNLYRIAKQYGISVHELCRLNKISAKNPILPGQRLLISSATRR